MRHVSSSPSLRAMSTPISHDTSFPSNSNGSRTAHKPPRVEPHPPSSASPTSSTKEHSHHTTTAHVRSRSQGPFASSTPSSGAVHAPLPSLSLGGAAVSRTGSSRSSAVRSSETSSLYSRRTEESKSGKVLASWNKSDPDESDSDAPHAKHEVGTHSPDLDPTNAVQVYGFVFWIISLLSLLCYLVWAYTPTSVLRSWGLHYYPSRYWAVALPGYFVMLWIFVSIIYMAINCMITRPLKSFDLLQDDMSKPLPERGSVGSDRAVGTPAISDMPINVVNKLITQPYSVRPMAARSARYYSARWGASRTPPEAGVFSFDVGKM